MQVTDRDHKKKGCVALPGYGCRVLGVAAKKAVIPALRVLTRKGVREVCGTAQASRNTGRAENTTHASRERRWCLCLTGVHGA